MQQKQSLQKASKDKNKFKPLFNTCSSSTGAAAGALQQQAHMQQQSYTSTTTPGPPTLRGEQINVQQNQKYHQITTSAEQQILTVEGSGPYKHSNRASVGSKKSINNKNSVLSQGSRIGPASKANQSIPITIDLDQAIQQQNGSIGGQAATTVQQLHHPVSSTSGVEAASKDGMGSPSVSSKPKKKSKKLTTATGSRATGARGGANTVPGGQQDQGVNGAGSGRLVIKPGNVQFSQRGAGGEGEWVGPKQARYGGRRQQSSQGTGQIEQKNRVGQVGMASPQAINVLTSHPKKSRAPRKQSKELERDGQKKNPQSLIATPSTSEKNADKFAYQTQMQPLKGMKMGKDVSAGSQSNNNFSKVQILQEIQSPVTASRVEKFNNKIIDLAKDVQQDKQGKYSTRLQDVNNSKKFNLEVKNRRNMKILQSLNSPQQECSDWFSVGNNKFDAELKSLQFFNQNDSKATISNQLALKLLDENRQSQEDAPSRMLENTEGRGQLRQREAFGAASWNSNLLSHELKRQPELRLASPVDQDGMGRNIDELPLLDSRQLSEGEENVLATQRYTESSQTEDVHRQIFLNQTSDHAPPIDLLECQDQQMLLMPYSERRTYKSPNSHQNQPRRQQSSRISSCQVSVSERNSRIRSNISEIICNASQSENLTADDVDQTEMNIRKSGRSTSKRALSGPGSVGNLKSITSNMAQGDQLSGIGFIQKRTEFEGQLVQKSLSKKLSGKQLSNNRQDGQSKKIEVFHMQSPKLGQLGRSEIELVSCKESRNPQLRVDKPHQSTRNSQVVKMSSLFLSKNEQSDKNNRANPAEQRDNSQRKLLNAYYQKAEESATQAHRPKVAGQRTHIKGLQNASKNLNDSCINNYDRTGIQNDTFDSHQLHIQALNNLSSSVIGGATSGDRHQLMGFEQNDFSNAIMLKDVNQGKNFVKTQMNINFKSLFKMNQLQGSYCTQQQPDNLSECHKLNNSLARVPQSSMQESKKNTDGGYGAQGSGRLYSKLSDPRHGLQMVKESLNNSALVTTSKDHAFSKRNSINQLNEMSLRRATGSQVRQGGASGGEAKKQNATKKRYKMDQKSTQTQLVIIKKDLKFITVNMLNMNLQLLDFQDNKLVSLPDEICQLAQLQTLKLDRNHLAKLPGNIGLLRKLEVLSLTKNELSEIPPTLQHCKALKELHVSDNKLEQLSPSMFVYMDNLELLHLHSNLVYQLPASITNLVKLNSLSLEWFIYLDPPQQVTQQGQAGSAVINEFMTFFQKQITLKDSKTHKKAEQRTFLEFMVQFYICGPLKKQKLSDKEIIKGINSLRFTGKQRCLAQTCCSNKHPHLFQEIVHSKSASPISRLINQNYDLNVTDTQDQAPLLGSLRQQSIEYPKILLSSPNIASLNLNQQSLKHGFPLHMAILSHKFEIALQMLKLKDQIDPNVHNSVGANVVHLLFVKYDKDTLTAYRILQQCLEVGVDLNLIDRMAAAPIHLALGKRQHQALKDMALINKTHNRRVFDFNIRDKRGQTPLHFTVDKQDHEMFIALIRDEWIDPHSVDSEEFQKSRRCSVIFSAFHHILYHREKLAMRRLNFSDRCLLKIVATRDLLGGTDGCCAISSSNTTWAQKRGSYVSTANNNNNNQVFDYVSSKSKGTSMRRATVDDQSSVKKSKEKGEEEEQFRSINQIKAAEELDAKNKWPQWQIRHPNSIYKEVPNQTMIDEISQFHQDANMFVTHNLLNFREKRKLQREQEMVQKNTLLEIQDQQNYQTNVIDKYSVAQENPYDVRGRAFNGDGKIGKGQVRSLSRISHLSYKSDATAFKKIHKQSVSKYSNSNTQKMNNTRKLEGLTSEEIPYQLSSNYFKSEARRQMVINEVDTVNLKMKHPHQRQKSTHEVAFKKQMIDGREGELNKILNQRIKNPQCGNKGFSIQQSFQSEQQQQIRMRKLLSRKQKSNSFDCDLQSQINNEYNSGEMLNVERMSRLQDPANKIEYNFPNNAGYPNGDVQNTEYLHERVTFESRKKEQHDSWQSDSMQTLMKKARNEYQSKNQNVMQRGSKSSQKEKHREPPGASLSFKSPSKYQKSMLQERKMGDAIPKDQIMNHSFNTRHQVTQHRPKTSFVDSYYNFSNSKMSSQAGPFDLKRSLMNGGAMTHISQGGRGYNFQKGGQPKIFGPKPENSTQTKSLRKGGNSKRVNNFAPDQNIDDVDFEIDNLRPKNGIKQVLESGTMFKRPQQQQAQNNMEKESDNTSSSGENADCRSSRDNKYDSGRIYISNLNININNVFLNVQDVSIPSTPSSRGGAGTKHDYTTEPMDFSNIKSGSAHGGGQIHKNIPSIRNIFAADLDTHHNLRQQQQHITQQSKDFQSDIEMLLKSNVQNIRNGSRQARQSVEGTKPAVGALEKPAVAGFDSVMHERDIKNQKQRISLQKMQKIVQK